MMTLIGCETPTRTSAELPEEKPAGCTQFQIITYWLGSAKTVEEVEVYIRDTKGLNSRARMDGLRGLLGDTSKTVLAVKTHNAGWRALCDERKAEDVLVLPRVTLHRDSGIYAVASGVAEN